MIVRSRLTALLHLARCFRQRGLIREAEHVDRLIDILIEELLITEGA